jgi:RHS repeat-associated protein
LRERNVIVRSYYGADERVHATQRIDEGSGGNRGVWEEYRYDPLGRRVLVRAVRQGQVTPASSGYTIQVCTGTGTACVSTVTRYVWAGDQVLWEMRSPGADGQNLENTTALGAGPGQSHLFGRVSYLHAGGIDRPLTIWKENVGSVLPHQNWRGLFSRGTWGYNSLGAVGTTANCVTVNVNQCLPLNWPGERTTAWHESGGESELWMGGLVDGMRDPTGQIYMRNRYYNPQTGQFTQMDPIGIAGGLNAYGFAAGDPVSYSDPYGLAVCANERHLRRAIERATNSTIEWVGNCVSSMSQVTFEGGSAWSPIQSQYADYVESPHTYNVNRGVEGRENPVGCNPGCSWYDNSTRTAWVFDQDFDRIENGFFKRGMSYGRCGFSLGAAPRYTAAGIILHELFGHGRFDGSIFAAHSFRRVFEYENMYNRIRGRPERCK